MWKFHGQGIYLLSLDVSVRRKLAIAVALQPLQRQRGKRRLRFGRRVVPSAGETEALADHFTIMTEQHPIADYNHSYCAHNIGLTKVRVTLSPCYYSPPTKMLL